MKSVLIISVVILLVLIVLQSYTVMASNKTEEQKYRVVSRDKGVEIRFYPAATLATVYSGAKNYQELSGPGFRRLAGYIFGGNESSTQISMTSPVHMEINDTVSAMSFVMPSGYNPDNLPKPNDPNLVIQQTRDEYIAAIRFGGYASTTDIEKYSEKLRKILDDQGIKTNGSIRYLGYNPPYQVIGRKNEVIVSIDWKE